MTGQREPQDRYLWIVRLSLAASGAALSAGLLVHTLTAERVWATALLRWGLLALMVTPVLRVLISAAERLRARDWQFVVVTLVVLIELSLTLFFAARRV